MHIDADALFPTLAHPLRLRALLLLHREGELCVCELTHAFGVSQPMISRHLAQMRQTGLVEHRRQGAWVYYRINAAVPEWVHQVLAATAAGLADQPLYADDHAALQAMPNRPGASCWA
ncbi:MAG: metalloregulator ArsR/SmtB family transcription factor [Gammaproteobacteria bacterium]